MCTRKINKYSPTTLFVHFFIYFFSLLFVNKDFNFFYYKRKTKWYIYFFLSRFSKIEYKSALVRISIWKEKLKNE